MDNFNNIGINYIESDNNESINIKQKVVVKKNNTERKEKMFLMPKIDGTELILIIFKEGAIIISG